MAISLDGIAEPEFAAIRDWLFGQTGITLSAAKKALVCARLFKRIQTLGLDSYAAYARHLRTDREGTETQIAIDLLTTNETYFFREAAHFDLLADLARRHGGQHGLRVWSAACSSGEEVYTIAMTLAELERRRELADWEVWGSDISARVLETAQAGLYSMQRMEGVAPELLKRYWLYGTGPYDGMVLAERRLRERCVFERINLIEALPEWAPFDVIFLRNVLIYFELAEKTRIVGQLLGKLRPGGVLLVGTAETLQGLFPQLVSIAPGAYRLDAGS